MLHIIFKVAKHIYCGPCGDLKIITLCLDLLKTQKHMLNKEYFSPQEDMRFFWQTFLQKLPVTGTVPGTGMW